MGKMFRGSNSPLVKRFFQNVSIMLSGVSLLDKTTKDRVRVDVAKFVIHTRVLDNINCMIKVKVLEDMYDVRLIEESPKDSQNCLICREKSDHDESKEEDLKMDL